MLFLLLILSLSPEVPEPLSQYIINPITGYFEADWRLGPSFNPTGGKAFISGINAPLLDDPSLIALLGLRPCLKNNSILLDPLFYREDKPAALLFSERGNSDLTHLGLFFGMPAFGKNGISLSSDSRYLSPEFLPSKRKLTQFTLAGVSNVSGKSLRFFILDASREGVLSQREAFRFGLLRVGNDSLLTLFYSDRKKPEWPLGRELGVETRLERDQVRLVFRGKTEFRDSDYRMGGGAQVEFSPSTFGNQILLKAGVKYNEELGYEPSFGVIIQKNGMKFTLERKPDALPYAWKKEGNTWQEEDRALLDISLLRFLNLFFSARRINNAIFFKKGLKEGVPTQFSGKSSLIEAYPTFKETIGIFRFYLAGRAGKLSPESVGYRKLNARGKFEIEKEFKDLEVKFRSSLIVDYFGESSESSEFLTMHLAISLYLFDSAEVKLSLFNIGGRVPQVWPLSFPGQTIQLGMSLLLWD